MNFLYRLHPGRALERGAVRPDLAPLLASASAPTAAAAPVVLDRPAAPARDAVSMSAPPVVQTASPAALQPAPPVLQVAAAAQDGPRQTPPSQDTPARAAQAAPALRIERVVQRETNTLSTVAAAPQAAAAAVPAAPTVPRRSAAAEQRTTAARAAAAPLAPLRVQALHRAPAAAAPTVVQVSIDRLDVRLPADPAAPPAPMSRRPRSAAAGPSLADYLRGKGGAAR